MYCISPTLTIKRNRLGIAPHGKTKSHGDCIPLIFSQKPRHRGQAGMEIESHCTFSDDPNNSRQRGFPVDHRIQRWTRERSTALVGTTQSRTTPPRQNEPVRAAARTLHPVSFDGVRRWLLDQRIHESLCFKAQRVVSQATNCCWRAPWAILPPCASRVAQCGRATSVEHARHHIISRAQASVRPPARHQVIVISARPHHLVGLLLLTQACRAEGEGQLRQARLQVRHRLMRAPRHCSSATRAASYSGVCFKMPIHLLVHINATDFMDVPGSTASCTKPVR